MPYTLKQAAEAAGKSKPTILRAIQSGKVSAHKDDHDEWRIDPAELHRVYPAVTRETVQGQVLEQDVIADEVRALRRELEIRDEQLATLEVERRREREILQDGINDLRRRLDAEAEERRKLTALLTYERPKPELAPVPTLKPQAQPSQKPLEGRLARAWSILWGAG